MSVIPVPTLGTALAACRSRADIAAFLETTVRRLTWLLYKRLIRNEYHEFIVPKSSGGERRIMAPPPALRGFQRKLASALLDLYSRRAPVHGFVREKSIATNARAHVRKRLVVNLDLKDFFPTIRVQRVIKVLESAPYSLAHDVAVIVAQIACHGDGRLPQGAATSPIISNIICRRLDGKLQEIAKRAGCTYTRYADDISFSSTRPRIDPGIIVNRIEHWVPSLAVRRAIKEEGFRINYSKFKVCYQGERQFVTGLSVNEAANVRRGYVRELNSIVHIWEKYGYETAEAAYRRHHSSSAGKPKGFLRSVLHGKLAFLHMVKGEADPVYRRLRCDLHSLDSTLCAPPQQLSPSLSTPLVGRMNARSDWTQVVGTVRKTVLFVEVRSRVTGDKNNATAFAIDHDLALTAGHVVHADLDLKLVLDDETELHPLLTYVANAAGVSDFAILKFSPGSFVAPFAQTECRIPAIGESVAAIGYPTLSLRSPTIVSHVGSVEALPTNFDGQRFFVQTSFQSGGGLSGSPLVDQRGRVLGIMIENIFLKGADGSPDRAYGQAFPIGYIDQALRLIRAGKLADLKAIGVEIH